MKLVLQCAGAKQPNAGTFRVEGRPVKFVMSPDRVLHEDSRNFSFCRPDYRIPESNLTWFEYLGTYNRSGSNPDRLLKACALYTDPAYAKALDVAKRGRAKVFILSAGWGLIRWDFLLPDYDITFSRAKNVKRYAIRSAKAPLPEFNQIADSDPEEDIFFFGGKDYLNLFYRLTRNVPAEKTVFYYHTADLPREHGFNYTAFTPGNPDLRTNWQYECFESFLKDAGLI
ncbi:MAG: hypothetical protein COR54_01485 [Elusimicrobia bacterium CG22_combo_CG10-13_8_21_14_all_63_91]|nr:MAG: hypothetical protein COR54_01485 [Elusimicrobia bacterium CG22_combo_CG10-13_8_21_14_all_63_91]